jgi:hypothetical protein
MLVGFDIKRGRLLRAIVSLVPALAVAAVAQNGFDLSNATIPHNELLQGGPPRDGIPSIDAPRFIKPSDVDFLREEDRVLSVKIDKEVRAYPLRILAWHEIVNDQIGEHAIAVTYCPLARTAMVFDRHINGTKLSFGVSGLLYQSDLVMYDRETDSLWPQISMKAVSGANSGASLRWLPSENTTWRVWRDAYPDGKVLSTQTGFSRDYSGQAYGSYERSGETMFPVRWSRRELSKKSWVIGIIINDQAKAYALDELKKEKRVQDNVAGQQIEIVYDLAKESAEVTDKQTGKAIPNAMAYWFAWQAFYPNTELFGH